MATKKSNKSLWIMLALIVIIAIVILFLPACGSRSAKNTPTDAEATTLVAVGDTAPDFSVALFGGDTLTLSSLRGKVVLLNFWATWCPPCREELTRVQSDLIDRFAGRDFVFLPISRGETSEIIAGFREKTGYTFTMGLDPDRAIYDLYASNLIPRNFLIDRDGKIITSTVGYEPEEFDTLIQTIQQTLEQ